MVRFRITGNMPERALLRLKRAKIGLYFIKKPQKDALIFSVNKKDEEKVFAIYPKLCYNKNGYSPYTAEKIGEYGVSAWAQKFKKRIGVIIGAMLFCGITLFADTLVLGVKISGTSAYKREVDTLLAESGIAPFSVYKSGKEEELCAQLLRLPSVEFCSVKKQGLFLKVELRLSDFSTPKVYEGDMISLRQGVITAISLLKGTPLKAVGDKVEKGEPIIGGYIQTPSGERIPAPPVARVQLACAYEGEYQTATEEEAFATAYLDAEIGDRDRIFEREIIKTETGFFVRLGYTVEQSVNL